MDYFVKDFLHYLKHSGSSFVAVETLKKEFLEHSFQELHWSMPWNLENPGRYVLTLEGTLIAFQLGEDVLHGFHIIGSHTDSPALQIKGSVMSRTEGYLQLNTEVYGGPILSSWFDRPLGLSGRICYDQDGEIMTKVVQWETPVALIPHLAIHLNRTVNDEGKTINPQKELPLFFGSDDEEITDFIARKANIAKESLLSFDLFLYDVQGPVLLGEDGQWVQAQKLDNLAMAYASSKALMVSKSKTNAMVIAWDNEEIGSQTQSGANSILLKECLERILASQGQHTREDFSLCCSRSFLISADMAHAVHANHPDVHDPVNRPKMGAGPVIKSSASKSYTSTAKTEAYFKKLCKKAQVPCQVFYNASDKRGGSTISPLTAEHILIPSVDVGSAMLAMHSIREIMHVKDYTDMQKVFSQFFNEGERSV